MKQIIGSQEQTDAGASQPVEKSVGRDAALRGRRRALLKLGGAAAPVLLTIHSGPVSATTSCIKASGFISAATFKSRNPGTNTIQCTTSGLTFWQAECAKGGGSSWNTVLDQTLATYFAPTAPSSSYNTQSLRSILTLSAGSPGPLSVLQRVLSMCLSIQHQGVPQTGDFTKAYLIGVWGYFAAGSVYNPTGSGISWDAATTATWLDRLMTSSLPL